MKRLWLGLALCGLSVSCRTDSKPVDPIWGKQDCAQCSMLVSDPKYAGQLVTPDGERKFFDDVGCLVAYIAEHKLASARSWVRSERGEWVDAQSTRYDTGAKSPMDYGFVPKTSGKVGFAELRRLVAEREGRARHD